MPQSGEALGSALHLQSIWTMVQRAAALVPDWVFKETTTASSLINRDASANSEEKSSQSVGEED
jgi:hypothetical protein